MAGAKTLICGRLSRLRAGLVAALVAFVPGVASAAACDSERPGWDGVPVTAVGELVSLMATPISLILLAVTVLALRFRSQWGGLGAVAGWSVWISLLVFGSPVSGARAEAIAEGCIGSPTLFIGLVAVICVATILYTAPRPKRTD